MTNWSIETIGIARRNLLRTCLLVLATVAALAVIDSELVADELVGRRWSPTERVSYDEVDHRLLDRLLKKYVDQDGMVNYRAWHANSEDRAALTQYLAELGKPDANKRSTKSAQLAYWINAYNGLTIEGILRVYPTTSIRNHTAKLIGYNIWKDLKLISGDQEISLDEIEHQVLRKMNEPRIHFAIVCASRSCPRLLNSAYTADALERQLADNTRDFFSRPQNFRIVSANRTLRLSSIISWFGSDFGKTQSEQLRYLAPYFPERGKRLVAAGGYRIQFQDYDWKLNEQSATNK